MTTTTRKGEGVLLSTRDGQGVDIISRSVEALDTHPGRCKTAAVTDRTPLAERRKQSLREDVLDAAAPLLSRHGFHGLRMADVAAAAGVSRQTVYNEFGGKEALVEAVALRTTAEFLSGVDDLMRSAPDFLGGFRQTVVFTLRHARENALVASVLGAEEAEDLLPFLTTKGEPILRSSAELFATHLHRRLPGIDAEQAALIAESAVRLVLSHLVLPTASDTHVADRLATLLGRLLDAYQLSQEVQP